MADWLGLRPELNQSLNAQLGLTESQLLAADGRYTNREIVERRMRSMFGEDHGLDWFEKNGLVAWERHVSERYPRGVLKLPRVPVYFPEIVERGRELKEVLDPLGVHWDLSSYAAVPLWSGCWSHKTRQSDQLFLVNYKLPFQTSTTTQYNPCRRAVAAPRLALGVTLNRSTAAARGTLTAMRSSWWEPTDIRRGAQSAFRSACTRRSPPSLPASATGPKISRPAPPRGSTSTPSFPST
jgi:hypothetical protein